MIFENVVVLDRFIIVLCDGSYLFMIFVVNDIVWLDNKLFDVMVIVVVIIVYLDNCEFMFFMEFVFFKGGW